MDDMNVGLIIAKLRKENNISQEALAEKLSVTRQAISNWERNKTQPDIDTLKQLAEIFNKDINYIIGVESNSEDTKVMDRKASTILYLINIGLVLSFIIYSALYRRSGFSSYIMLLIPLLISTTVYFVFGSSLKNNDFTIIAGYNRNIKYNESVFKKILITQELMIIMSSLTYSALFLLVILDYLPPHVSVILLLVYIVTIISGVFLVSYKYRDSLIIDKEDKIIAKESSYVGILFIISIFSLLLTTIVSMKYFGIENNTGPALLIALIVLVFSAVNIPWLIYEQNLISKKIKDKVAYKKSKYSVIIFPLNIILLIIIVYISYMNRI